MYIKEIVAQNHPTISFELFPPKQVENMDKFLQVVKDTAALNPSFISVTYGATGGTAKLTVELAEYVQSCGVTALAHLTCVSASREQISVVVDRMKKANINNILALRGDIPEGMDLSRSEHYRYASDLVADVKKLGDFCVGGACYPEGHVDSPNKALDIDHLKAKVDTGCDFLVSQMFFDNNNFYRFLYRTLDKGINVPILAGIMPVTNKTQIQRIIKFSGTELPARFISILDRFGDKPDAMRQAGIAYATDQIIDLIANGVNHIHLYTMNKPDIAAAITQNLSSIIEG